MGRDVQLGVIVIHRLHCGGRCDSVEQRHCGEEESRVSAVRVLGVVESGGVMLTAGNEGAI
jgi:hypothetical protein